MIHWLMLSFDNADSFCGFHDSLVWAKFLSIKVLSFACKNKTNINIKDFKIYSGSFAGISFTVPLTLIFMHEVNFDLICIHFYLFNYVF
jgi:hypothetical protein